MDKFLELSKLSRDGINNFNRYIATKETEAVSQQKYRSRWIPLLNLNKILKNEHLSVKNRKGTLLFYEDNSTLIPKLDKDTTKKKTLDKF